MSKYEHRSTAFNLGEHVIDNLANHALRARYSAYPDESFARIMGKKWPEIPLESLLEIIKIYRETSLTVEDLDRLVGSDYRMKLKPPDPPKKSSLKNDLMARKSDKERKLRVNGYVGIRKLKEHWFACYFDPYQNKLVIKRCKSKQAAMDLHDEMERRYIPEDYQVVNKPIY